MRGVSPAVKVSLANSFSWALCSVALDQFFGIKALHFFIGHILDDPVEIEAVIPNLQRRHLGVFRHALAVSSVRPARRLPCSQPGRSHSIVRR